MTEFENLLTKNEIKNLEIQTGVSYKVFNKKDELTEYISEQGYKFSGCLFNFDLFLDNTSFVGKPGHIPIDFRGAYFAGVTNFSYSKFLEYTCFEDTTFRLSANFCQVEFHECKNNYIEDFTPSVSFIGAKFLDDVNFNDAIFHIKASFDNVNFAGISDFTSTKFNKKVDLVSCIFEQESSFEYYQYDSTEQPSFEADFRDSVFKKKVVFNNRVISKLKLENVRFEALSNFYKATFRNDIRFFKTDFIGTCVFSGTTFKRKAIFHYTQVAKNMILREAHFNGGLNLAPINFIDGGYINPLDVKIDNFNSASKRTDIDENDNWKIISSIHKRETFRILKNEALKQNNRIEALNFHAKEMYSFLGERLTWKNAWNKVLLSLNLISNGFGLWWWLGLIFIIFTGFIFYSWLLNSWNVFSETWRIGYLQFILPTHSITDLFPKGYNIRSYHYAIDIAGRVFIGFGIYQTIQAFRKYGRF